MLVVFIQFHLVYGSHTLCCCCLACPRAGQGLKVYQLLFRCVAGGIEPVGLCTETRFRVCNRIRAEMSEQFVACYYMYGEMTGICGP